MKSKLTSNRLVIAGAALLICLVCGFALHAQGPDRIVQPASKPATSMEIAALKTPPAVEKGRSEFEIESHCFVVDERRFHLLPDAVQSRLTAHGNQLIGGEEIDAFVHAMQGLAVPLPEIPTMKLPEQESLRMLVETQQAYVSSLTKVLAPGAGLFDPTVSVTTDRGVDLCCSVRNHADGSGSVVSGSAKVSRLVALIPVTQTMKIESLANPGKFQVVSGTYQLPVTAKYDLRFSGCAVPNGQALLVASLGQTLENAGTATTQPAITQANRDSIGQEEHEHVFLLLKPRLISIGVAP